MVLPCVAYVFLIVVLFCARVNAYMVVGLFNHMLSLYVSKDAVLQTVCIVSVQNVNLENEASRWEI